jgi:hypothetical protein
MESIFEWEMVINAKDCDWDGKELKYVMSTNFTKWFLGNIKNEGYPNQISVQGKTLKKFKRVGLSFGYDLYVNGEWLLKIYNRKNEEKDG